MNEYCLYVKGTHCAACKVLIEDVLSEQPGVSNVTVDLVAQKVTVQCEASDVESAAALWTTVLKPHGYSLSLTEQKKSKDFKTLWYAVPLGLIILVLFFWLQRSGIVTIGFAGELTPWTAVLIGIIASLSTCLAVVGGLVLSLSAKVSKDVSTARPFSFFHVGRLVGFMVLGGILGAVGGAVSINSKITTVLGLLVAVVMVILGINLLDVFHRARRLQFTLPRGLSRITKIEKGFFAPFIVGAGTFFLPCGFTQSMQLAALSSGSAWQGSLIMTAFAVGTLPMLALLSFGSFRFAHTRYASLFFKTAGIVVIGLGIFAILTGLAGLGIIRPLFSI
jgi:sulfite exporter TauE/SafE/copper chaperone CopZ